MWSMKRQPPIACSKCQLPTPAATRRTFDPREAEGRPRRLVCVSVFILWIWGFRVSLRRVFSIISWFDWNVLCFCRTCCYIFWFSRVLSVIYVILGYVVFVFRSRLSFIENQKKSFRVVFLTFVFCWEWRQRCFYTCRWCVCLFFTNWPCGGPIILRERTSMPGRQISGRNLAFGLFASHGEF